MHRGEQPRECIDIAVDGDIRSRVGTRVLGPAPADPSPGGLVIGTFRDPEGNLVGVAAMA